MIINESGGGAGLNLKVVGGTIQPSNPKENTVWVNTSTAINGYAFSADAPTNPVEGMVWCSMGAYSTAPINIDKKNTVMLYPTSCKQYLSGAWILREAQSYQNGVWLNWWTGALYSAGNLYEDITGGWTTRAIGIKPSINTPVAPTVTYNPQTVSIRAGSSQYAYGLWHTKNKIDLSKFSTISVKLESYSGQAASSGNLQLITEFGSTAQANVVAETYWQSNVGTVTLDISNVNLSCYVCIGAYWNANFTISEIHLT